VSIECGDTQGRSEDGGRLGDLLEALLGVRLLAQDFEALRKAAQP
jgi:hypothetical protein